MPDKLLLPPQALRLASATISARTPTIDSHLRRRAGIPRKTRKARTEPPPAHARPKPLASGRAMALVAAVEETVTVAVPLVVLPPRVIVELPPEQVGRSVAPAGDAVSAHDSVTVPEYPVAVVTVIVEVEGDPGATAAGVVAANVNTDAVTVTEAVPVPPT